ncbi:MAG: LPS-assembly protein LptD [Bacteroidetes bacterium]|nr:LPS-assembly protein LptD [Bacteroidota bacterium]
MIFVTPSRAKRMVRDTFPQNDSTTLLSIKDIIKTDSSLSDTTKRKHKPLLEDIIHTKNSDSMVYDLANGKMYLYNNADVKYSQNVLKADYMEVELDKNVINAKGVFDSTRNEFSKTTFKDTGKDYEMDSMSYNLKSQKAKIRGVTFVEGEGFIHGKQIKKMKDNTINIADVKYTTCDHEHPHFYIASSKAQLIENNENKNIVFGPSYLVLEDVPLPVFLPFGFFPVVQNKKSGIIIPSLGEEVVRGFFLRDGGYYWAINDKIDLTIRGGIYTLGSWNTNISTSYKTKYKYSGSLTASYANDVIGDKGSTDYSKSQSYKLQWQHTQDPKFLPNSTFSAKVDLSSGSYDKYNGGVNDYMNSQTNSSVAFSKTWAGTPFSISANLQHSQNNRDSSVVMSLPNVVFNVNKIYPFRRRNAVGKKQWYEKISFSYTGTLNNQIKTTIPKFMTEAMFDDMKYGIKHSIPVNTSFNILKYLNVSPSFSYNEKWYFNKIKKEWSPETNSVIVKDTTKGFYRVYDYSASLSFSTIVYGMYNFGKDKGLSAIRHVVTPSFSASYKPDFSKALYGFYDPVQTDASGKIDYYSPYEQGIFGGPSKGESASISFSLNNNIEAKVKSKQDSTGFKKIKIFESLNFSSSYNFLAESYKLAPVSISARTTLFKGLGINFSATLDPYVYDEDNIRIDKLAWSNNSLGRITNFNLTFGYSLRSFFGAEGKGSGTGSETIAKDLTPDENADLLRSGIDPNVVQQLKRPEYYNFSVPWNLSFNYQLSYSNRGGTTPKQVTQTMSMNGSVNLTPKWGTSFSGGIDFNTMKLTPGSINITRDLHCWQMGFSWVPIGLHKSWTFNINVKSSVLQDLKFKKSSGFLENNL